MTETAQPQQQKNPLLEGLHLRRRPDPCVIVIFGASGDLTKRKLFPALYSLALRRLLPEKFGVIGVARTEESDDEFRERMKRAVQEFGRDDFDDDTWKWLADGMRYVSNADPSGEDRVAELLTEMDKERGTAGNRVYYLAVPPNAIAGLVSEVGKRRSSEGWTRLVVEKPFGRDLESAEELNREIWEYFDEKEVFRIDHYLGKETVQNLLALRFANGIFEPIWSRVFVDHVQITVAESIGIEGRAAFYEQAGAIRDVFQNHLLQLVALTAMEPPVDFGAESVRNEKVKVLKALQTPAPQAVVRGQYGPGFIEGEEVPGYREEQGVDPQSMTETYVAAKLFIENWRWAGTPFYVRAGKRLARRETTIAIEFKRAPHPPFELSEELAPNALVLHIQPDEGVSLEFAAKVPGQGMTLRTVHMDFLYGGAFRMGIPEAYERLLLDCLLGDATLFTRADEVEEQWSLVDARAADVPELRRRLVGAGGRGRDPARGRPPVATALASISDIDRELARLRIDPDSGEAYQRTSVMTHIAWVPSMWVEAAEDVLSGLAERHPSRTIVLVPCHEDDDGLEASVEVDFFPVGSHREVATETIRVRLGGARAEAPASVVQPLLLPDLPVFLRWRGLPPFGDGTFDQLVDVVDRLIVDSNEWPDLPNPYPHLAGIFDRVVVSDIAWARTSRWRPQLASLWPGIADVKQIEVEGTEAQACLLAGWLRSRLGHDVELSHVEADRLVGVKVDGEPTPFPPGIPPDPADLLSDELESFTRDRAFEDAVRAA
jgi:glucose-6-phosphate 1-dehydrogenase